jgi:hypothetical protein
MRKLLKLVLIPVFISCVSPNNFREVRAAEVEMSIKQA